MEIMNGSKWQKWPAEVTTITITKIQEILAKLEHGVFAVNVFAVNAKDALYNRANTTKRRQKLILCD